MGFQSRSVFSHENALRKENRAYFLQFLSAVSHFLLTSLHGNTAVGGRRFNLGKSRLLYRVINVSDW